MFLKILVVVALSTFIFVGCGTTDGEKIPDQNQSDEFVKHKRIWDSPRF